MSPAVENPDRVELMMDVSPAEWIRERMWPWGPGSGRTGVAVGCVVPEGFAAYVRVLHPAMREMAGGREIVRWATVAQWTGRTVHPLMQWDRIAGLRPYQIPSWGYPPREGQQLRGEAQELVRILREATSTPDHCYFCTWDGYGVIDRRRYAGVPRVLLPHREYRLYRADIDAAISLADGPSETNPNLWWPDDRAWIVATEIDLTESYIGGSQACIEQILADPALETFAVDLNARIDSEGDVVNR